METKDEVIRKLEKKIENKKRAIRENISFIIDSLNELDSSLDFINFLSYLKNDLIKKDGV